MAAMQGLVSKHINGDIREAIVRTAALDILY